MRGPQRAKLLEDALVGERPENSVLDEAVRLSTDIECIADVHASEEYRRHLFYVLARQALTRAARQAVSES